MFGLARNFSIYREKGYNWRSALGIKVSKSKKTSKGYCKWHFKRRVL